MKTFTVAVVAPAQPLQTFEARHIMVPGEVGYIGIMADREPLLVNLGVGIVQIDLSDGREKWFAVTGGFFEVVDNHATLLADDIIGTDKIDNHLGHMEGKPTIFPVEFSSEIQKLDLAAALLKRKMAQTKDSTTKPESVNPR